LYSPSRVKTDCFESHIPEVTYWNLRTSPLSQEAKAGKHPVGLPGPSLSLHLFYFDSVLRQVGSLGFRLEVLLWSPVIAWAQTYLERRAVSCFKPV
tara:strand:+ start:63 stop:350 length:288 start_codon:yes stop_codon:yes gene_type:complete